MAAPGHTPRAHPLARGVEGVPQAHHGQDVLPGRRLPRCPGAPVLPARGWSRVSAVPGGVHWCSCSPPVSGSWGVTDTKASKKSVLHLLSNTLVIFDTQIHQVTGARAYFPQLRTSSPDQPGQWPPPGLAQVTQ